MTEAERNKRAYLNLLEITYLVTGQLGGEGFYDPDNTKELILKYIREKLSLIIELQNHPST